MSQDQPRKRAPLRSDAFLRFTSMATQMGVIIFLGVWGGMQLDKKFPNDFHGWTLGLSLFSVFVAIYRLIKDLSR